MVLLFLLAVLLAWPTAGISIIAYVAFAVFKSYLNAKSRMHYANERRSEHEVQSGGRHVPSWASSNDENQIFVEVIQKEANRKGVPQTFLWAVLGDKDTFQSLVFLAGAMERKGASFIEQQVAVSDKLVAMWEQAPANVRTAATNPELPNERYSDMFWQKKDHSPAIEKVVVNLISTGQETGVLPWLSIKDAIHYAHTQEGQPVIANNNTMVQCHATIDGAYYNLCFESHPNNGVYLTPTKYFDVEE